MAGTIQSDEIILRRKEDATPQFLSQVRDADQKGGCAGTFHPVGSDVLPCMGDGMVVRRYEQTTYRVTPDEHKEIIGAFVKSVKSEIEIKQDEREFGDPNPSAMIETTNCRPLSVDICPCKRAERLDEYQEGILKDLGLEKIPTLSPKQKEAVDNFKKNRQSLFIYGANLAGKTTLAGACAMTYQRGVKVLKGDEIATELRVMAMNNEKPRYTGLLILDDIARMTPTEAMREKLFLIFDAARAGKSFRLIITSKDDAGQLCDKFSLGDQKAAKDLLVRFSALTEVKL